MKTATAASTAHEDAKRKEEAALKAQAAARRLQHMERQRDLQQLDALQRKLGLPANKT